MPTNPRPLTETVSRATGQSDPAVREENKKLDELTGSSSDSEGQAVPTDQGAGGNSAQPAGGPYRSIQFADEK